MRELEHYEVGAVSGAGVIADTAESVGKGIGTVIDFGTSLFGIKTDFSTAKGKLDKGIGQLFELNFTEAFTNISGGINGLISSISTLFNKSSS